MAEILAFPGTRTTTTAGPVEAGAPLLKRCAIIGTAPSWKQCPWHDMTMEKWGLNDGYLLGVPHADRWYDLHPIHQMSFRPSGQRVVPPQEVPVGAYLRPEGHLEWLRTRPIPVYIPQARPDWPTSRTFPKDEILAFFAPYWPLRVTKANAVEPGPDYEVSTPAWMLMQAIMEGYTEISVFGIHLATQWEYVEQRPNFEWLLGVAAGRGVKIVLPAAAPICRARYRYAFEPKADIPHQVVQRRIEAVKAEGLALRRKHATLPWYARDTKKDLEARLGVLDVDLLDARGEQQRLMTQQNVGL